MAMGGEGKHGRARLHEVRQEVRLAELGDDGEDLVPREVAGAVDVE